MKAAFRFRYLFAAAAGAALLFTITKLPAQITPATTQPEPQPDARIPSPRSDDADFDRDEGDPVIPPGPRQPGPLPNNQVESERPIGPAAAERRSRLLVPATPVQMLGRIVRIKDRELTITPPDDKAENVTVLVAPDAEVVLNKKPARLTDLQPYDLTRVTMSKQMAGVAEVVWAARVKENPPPNFQITGPPPRRPIREPLDRSESSPAEGTGGQIGALGVAVFDSPGVGVLVVAVDKGSPADRAGIQEGDYFTAVGLREVVTPTAFVQHIGSFLPDSEVQLTLWRLGEPREVDVVLSSRQAVSDRVVTRLLPPGDEGTAIPEAETAAQERTVNRPELPATDAPESEAPLTDELNPSRPADAGENEVRPSQPPIENR